MSPGAQLAALSGMAVVLAAAAVWIVSRVTQGSPEKRERRRRLHVNLHGRLGDALVTEANQSALYYTYTISGVQYTASQDIAALTDRLPAQPERLVGISSLKYSSKNPANSILICEDWSGLRVHSGPRPNIAETTSLQS